MIASTKFQKAYNELYRCIREYIWDFNTVNILADLEIETYKSFPDIDKLQKHLSDLKRDVSATDVYDEDEELKAAFEDFESLLDDTDEIYASLKTFKKVVVV